MKLKYFLSLLLILSAVICVASAVKAQDATTDSSSDTADASPAISITAPVAEANFFTGKSTYIRWTADSTIKKINITLVNSESGDETVIRNGVSAAKGNYLWSISKKLSPGSYTINLTDADNEENISTSDSFNLAVRVSSIKISAPASKIPLSSTLQLDATVSPNNASDPTVTWSVKKGTGNGTIDDTGLFTPKKVGTVTVTATANDGSKVKSTKTITVTKAAKIKNQTPSSGNTGSSTVTPITPVTITTTSAVAPPVVDLPTLTLTSPVGGENWQTDIAHAITWASRNVQNVSIYYIFSTDVAGQDVKIKIADVPASPGSFLWTPGDIIKGNTNIPNPTKLPVKIMISDSGSSASDTSDLINIIYPVTACTPNWQCVSSCSGGYTRSAPKDLNNCGTASAGQIMCSSSVTYLPDGCPGDAAATQPSINITSPNGGEKLVLGQQYPITWTGNSLSQVFASLVPADSPGNGIGALGVIGTVSSGNVIYWDGKTVYSDINSGTPIIVPPGNYKIYLVGNVANVIGQAVNDMSANSFTISASTQPTIAFSSPNGVENWKVGETHNIIWKTINPRNSNVYIGLEAYDNSGNQLGMTTITNSVLDSAGLFSWTIGRQTITGANKYKIVIDDSPQALSNFFTISAPATAVQSSIICPSGTIWNDNAGTCTHNPICPTGTSWGYNNTLVKSLCSGGNQPCPSGQTWNSNINLCVANQTCSAGETWNQIYELCTVAPNAPSCTSTSNCSTGQTCVNGYCIYEPAAIAVDSPVGQAQWAIGSTQIIRWSSITGFPPGDMVSISLINGTDKSVYRVTPLNTPISASTGSYSWTIPSNIPVGSQYSISILDGENVNISPLLGQYSKLFSIVAPADSCVTAKDCQDKYQNCYYSCSNNSCVKINTLVALKPYPDCSSVLSNTCTPNWQCVSSCSAGYTSSALKDLNNCGTSSAGQISCPNFVMYSPNGCSGDPTVTTQSSVTVPSATAQPSITITSPAGGEVWKNGETHNITWTSTGLSGIICDPSVGLNDASGKSSDGFNFLNPTPTTQGSYPWTVSVKDFPSGIGYVSSDVAGGTNYKVKVDVGCSYQAGDGSGKFVGAFSNPFYISRCIPNWVCDWDPLCLNHSQLKHLTDLNNCRVPETTSTVPCVMEQRSCGTVTTPSTTAPSNLGIVLTSPAGGESWKVGETHNITWNLTWVPGTPTTVQIVMASKSNFNNFYIIQQSLIANNGAGSFSWKIPANVSPGTDYSVGITAGGKYSATTPYTIKISAAGTTALPAAAASSSSPCKANWQAGGWGSCVSGVQTQVWTDSNVCNASFKQFTSTQTCR